MKNLPLEEFRNIIDRAAADGSGRNLTPAQLEGYALGVANLGLHLRRVLYEGLDYDGREIV